MDNSQFAQIYILIEGVKRLLPREELSAKRTEAGNSGAFGPRASFGCTHTRPRRGCGGLSLRGPNGAVAISQSVPECHGIATAGFAHLAMTPI